jgi:hypothetical protein
LTVLYLSPLNPIKAALMVPIQQHTRDLFAQNWSLFAPDPLHNNTALLVSCKTSDQEQSDWYNINRGMIEAFHKQPMGPYARLSRIDLAAIRFYQGFADPTTEQTRLQLCEHDPNNQACTRQDENSLSYKKIGKEILARLGSAACVQINRKDHNNIKPLTEVKLRVLFATVKPYSERNRKDWMPSVSGFETDWLPYEQVAPIPFKLIREDRSA